MYFSWLLFKSSWTSIPQRLYQPYFFLSRHFIFYEGTFPFNELSFFLALSKSDPAPSLTLEITKPFPSAAILSSNSPFEASNALSTHSA